MKKFFTKFKKIVLVFLTILMLSLSLAPSAKAAVSTSWYNQSYKDWFLKVYSGNDSEIFGERYTAAQVQWILHSLETQIVGLLLGGNYEVAVCLAGKDISSCAEMIENGFKDILTYDNNSPQSFLAIVTSNPASGIGYIHNLINKFSLVPEANAQNNAGFGFTAASPVLAVWKISRDITYGLMVLVIIVFAFMIMFRVKINPQTVVTVQSALPKIVISAVLITFSYAIAGLLIDIMYVFMGLIAAIATQSNLFEMNFSQMIAALLNKNIFTIYLGYWFGFGITTLSTILSLNAIYGVIMLIFWIILIIILLVASFKGMIALLKNLAMLLISIITGPFEILFGTLSSTGGFGSWLMKIVSYLAVYPVIAIIILMAHFFLAQGMPEHLARVSGLLAFSPNWMFTTNEWHVPFSALELNGLRIVWIAVSYVLIIMIPKVFDIIKGFMEKKPFDYGTAIGQAFDPIAKWGPLNTARQYSADYGAYKLAGTLKSVIKQGKVSEALRLRTASGGGTPGLIDSIEAGAKSRLNIP